MDHNGLLDIAEVAVVVKLNEVRHTTVSRHDGLPLSYRGEVILLACDRDRGKLLNSLRECEVTTGVVGMGGHKGIASRIDIVLGYIG